MNDPKALLQGTQEWLAERLGKATASRMDDVTARTRSGYSASRANYAAELITERLTGRPYPRKVTEAMQWGTDKQADAITCYQLERNVAVTAVGFVPHPSIAMAGASPDGLVGADGDGLVEVKCPGTAQHLATLDGQDIDAGYVKQMLFQLSCTGRKWVDWVSYDPRLPIQLQIVIRRVQPPAAAIAELEGEVGKFLAEVDEREKRYWKMIEAKAAA